eukprot:3094836-Rhodomonas_salina.1
MLLPGAAGGTDAQGTRAVQYGPVRYRARYFVIFVAAGRWHNLAYYARYPPKPLIRPAPVLTERMPA